MNKYESPRGQTPLIFANSKTRKIVEVFHSLPLSSREINEVLEDHSIEVAFQASQNRSAIRRRPKRYESQAVIDTLDDLADTVDLVGEWAVKITLNHLRILKSVDPGHASEF